MRQVLISVSAVLVSGLMLSCGNGLLGTLLGVRLALGETEAVIIGGIMSAYFGGLLLGSLYADRMIRRVGHIRSFSALASILSAAALAHAFLPSLTVWGLLRLAEGFAVAGLFMCMESWLNDRAPNAYRGQVMSCYMIVIYAGLGAGQFLLLVESPEGFALFALSSVLLSVALVPLALTRYAAPELLSPQPFGFRRLMEISPLGVVGSFTSGVVLGAVYGLGPAYTLAIGMDTHGTAFFMAAVLFGGLLLQWPIGRVSDRFDRRRVIAAVAVASAATSLGMILTAGWGSIVLFVTAVVFGGAIYLLYPLSVTHANDFIPAEDLVPASGGLLLAYSTGATIGPAIAAAAMSLMGNWGLFAITGLAGLAMTGFALSRMIHARPIPAETETRFAVVPRTTPVSAELDPRGEAPQGGLDLRGPASATS